MKEELINHPDIGAVVIGRNEGERLKACLRSLVGRVATVVYVDSGSTDGSGEFARSLGVFVVDLDLTKAFSMARARNAGWQALLKACPKIDYVQFVDGDCVVEDGWIGAALGALKENETAALVCGRRSEIHPEHSLYNQFCDIEWNTPVGEARSCGGDFLVRAQVLRDSGGMNESLIAGEEPEWCLRLRKEGWKILRIEKPMTRHDAAILKFRQWWRRNRRGGYGALDAWERCRSAFPEEAEEGIPFDHLVKSSRAWTKRFVITAIGTFVVVFLVVLMVEGDFWESLGAGMLIALVAVCGLGLIQGWRIARMVRGRHPSSRVRLLYGIFTVIGKVPQVLGQRDYRRDREAGRTAQLIEYKGESSTIESGWGDWRADRQRCGRSAFFREPSLWALWFYRFGRWNASRNKGIIRWLFDRFYWLGYRTVGTFTGIGLDRLVEAGPGLRIHHFGNIFIHSDVKIGRNCTLRQGMTIGNRSEEGGVPTLDDDVECGAYAQILGEIRIGKGAKIGALSVVLQDVPPGYTAVGIPARLIPPKSERNEEKKPT